MKNSKNNKRKVKLIEEHILLLNLSDNDIRKGKMISHSELDKNDLKWLKALHNNT